MFQFTYLNFNLNIEGTTHISHIFRRMLSSTQEKKCCLISNDKSTSTGSCCQRFPRFSGNIGDRRRGERCKSGRRLTLCNAHTYTRIHVFQVQPLLLARQLESHQNNRRQLLSYSSPSSKHQCTKDVTDTSVVLSTNFEQN